MEEMGMVYDFIRSQSHLKEAIDLKEIERYLVIYLFLYFHYHYLDDLHQTFKLLNPHSA
jgi:hypothetical protein